MSNNQYKTDHNYSIFIQRGYLLIQQRQYVKAIEHFENILSDYPDDNNLLIGLSLAYYHNNKTFKAISAALSALNINPENYEAYEILAWIYFTQKHDNEIAEEYALKALSLKPDNSSIYSLLAQIYYFQRNYNKCFFYAKESLKLNPENYSAYMILGLYYYEFQDLELSEQYFSKCLEIAPNSADVYCNYGLISLEFAQNKKGYELLREAVKLNPDVLFYQNSFKEGFIRNHLLYLPISIINFEVSFPYMLAFTITSWILCAIVSQLEDLQVLPTIIGKISVSFTIIFCFFLFILILYRFIIRLILTMIYQNAIKKGILHKII